MFNTANFSHFQRRFEHVPFDQPHTFAIAGCGIVDLSTQADSCRHKQNIRMVPNKHAEQYAKQSRVESTYVFRMAVIN